MARIDRVIPLNDVRDQNLYLRRRLHTALDRISCMRPIAEAACSQALTLCATSDLIEVQKPADTATISKYLGP